MIALAYALEYAARGLHAIPLRPRCKRAAIADWPRAATTDRAQLARWFRGAGAANIGMVCGPSGIVVIDVDRHGADGYETLATLERELGALSATWTQDSGGGGEHRIYRAPAVALVTSAGPGVDVLAGARYVVVEPSVHPSGRARPRRDGLAPWDVDLVELPGAWLERLRRRERAPAPVARPVAVPDGGDVYCALAALNQGYVLLTISGSPLVGGEAITIGPPDRGGHRAIIVDGRVTGGFVDCAGKIVHRPTRSERPDGGPLVSTWCRFYGHGDAMIRWMLVAIVPELARFARGARRQTQREPSPADLRGDRE